MSRTRQIPVMDITQRERMLHQTQPQPEPYGNYSQPPYHPMARPAQAAYRPRTRKSSATRFRLSDTPSLISNGCSTVRQLCNNVQNITMDLNNLIGSVESMVPLLNTYLAVVQNRNTTQESEPEPAIDVTTQEYTAPNCTAQRPPVKEPATTQNTVTNPSQQPIQNMNPATPPMPRPEDIQQLLENPLVRNLLVGFMQNGAFPNNNTMKENAPRQS